MVQTAKSRVPQDHALIGQAQQIPINEAGQVVSWSPVVLPVPTRLVDLQMRLSAPVAGKNLPIILLSHGHGQSNNLSSMNGYGPIANFWAAHGFVVIQPTHLSSKTLSFSSEQPEAPLFWRSRIQDMKDILDQHEQIEDLVPPIKGRLDWDRVAVTGHSLGGHTASMLLGGKNLDPEDRTIVEGLEPRIKAGILLAPPGTVGEHVGPMSERFPFLKYPDFSEMLTPTLVVVGDADVAPHLTTRGQEYHADPYTNSAGDKALLTVLGGKHILGGISGYDAAETDDESPEKVALIQRITWAYLRSIFYPGDTAWTEACAALQNVPELGHIEVK